MTAAEMTREIAGETEEATEVTAVTVGEMKRPGIGKNPRQGGRPVESSSSAL